MTDKINIGETLITNYTIKEPIQENTAIFFNHFGRYFLAAKELGINKTDSIIDASCGTGYGSYGLAQKAKNVYGLDINSAYLEIAKKYFKKNNLEFYTYDEFYSKRTPDFYSFDDLNYTKSKIDKIVCIETFEHIPQNEVQDFFDKLLFHLKKDGSMFITVPLGQNNANTYNHFHCNEPSIDIIYGIFSKYFTNIKMDIDSFVNSFGYECQYCYLTLKGKEK